jgi:DNA-binding NarL/FixJ family response regulator
LVAEGLGNREIAQQLKLSEHTVRNYLFRIFDKLGVSNRVELVLYAATNRRKVPSAADELDQTGKPPSELAN